jgi:hypothetical protein
MRTAEPLAALSDEARLRGMLGDLRASGFHLGPDQRLRALAVFLTVPLSRGGARSAERVASLLGPVLSRSADEQRTFGRIVRSWFPSEEPDAEPPVITRREITPRGVMRTAERRAARGRALRSTTMALGAAAALTVLALVLDRVVPPLVVRRGSVDVVTGGGLAHLQTMTVDAAGWIVHVLGPAHWVLWLVPLTVVASGLVAWRLTLVGYARRMQVGAGVTTRRLRLLENPATDPAPEFFRLVQPLRRPIEFPSTELDVDATITQTIAHAGMPTLVFAKRRSAPEYTVLVDKRGTDDHAAQRCESLIEALREAGLDLRTYEFDGDPRLVKPSRGGRSLDIAEIATGAESRRLIVFSDGAGFLDERSGAPFPWTSIVAEWPWRAIFTWRAPEDWSRREWLLESQLGFALLPATEDGLIRASSRLAGGDEPTARAGGVSYRVMPDRRRLDGLLFAGTWRGMDAAPVGPADGDELVAALRSELTTPAFEWLCALAVFPSIAWSLTLYLGERVIASRHAARELKVALLEIARLPWLRYARMPLWLRERLAAAMPRDLRSGVRSALERMLAAPAGETAGLSLEVVIGTPEPQAIDARRSLIDAVVLDVVAREAATPSGFRLPAAVVRALGLRELRAVRAAARLQRHRRGERVTRTRVELPKHLPVWRIYAGALMRLPQCWIAIVVGTVIGVALNVMAQPSGEESRDMVAAVIVAPFMAWLTPLYATGIAAAAWIRGKATWADGFGPFRRRPVGLLLVALILVGLSVASLFVGVGLEVIAAGIGLVGFFATLAVVYTFTFFTYPALLIGGRSSLGAFFESALLVWRRLGSNAVIALSSASIAWLMYMVVAIALIMLVPASSTLDLANIAVLVVSNTVGSAMCVFGTLLSVGLYLNPARRWRTSPEEDMASREIPESELSRWSWGPFVLSPLWPWWNAGWRTKMLTAVVIAAGFAPFVGLLAWPVFAIYLGMNGNRLMVRHRPLDGYEEFIAVKTAWARAACIVAVLTLLFGLAFVARVLFHDR